VELTIKDTQDLHRWEQLVEKANALRVEELALRKELAARLFVDPKEGVNRVELNTYGWSLVLTHTISRTVDSAALTASKETLRSAGINVDELIRFKPELSVSSFRKLTDEQHSLFDNVLVIKPGCPALEIKQAKH